MEYTKKQLIEEVKNNTEVGQKICEIEIAYLRALADGSLLEEINKINYAKPQKKQ